MTRQTIITTVCDMPHAKGIPPGGAKPFEISDDRRIYSIDLCVEHAKQLAGFITNAHTARSRKRQAAGGRG